MGITEDYSGPPQEYVQALSDSYLTFFKLYQNNKSERLYIVPIAAMQDSAQADTQSLLHKHRTQATLNHQNGCWYIPIPKKDI